MGTSPCVAAAQSLWFPSRRKRRPPQGKQVVFLAFLLGSARSRHHSASSCTAGKVVSKPQVLPAPSKIFWILGITALAQLHNHLASLIPWLPDYRPASPRAPPRVLIYEQRLERSQVSAGHGDQVLHAALSKVPSTPEFYMFALIITAVTISTVTKSSGPREVRKSAVDPQSPTPNKHCPERHIS